MKVLKGALLLLLLAVANAKPDHHQHHHHDHHHDHNHDHDHNHTDQKAADSDHCQVLKMLSRDDLQQILGDWFLVWSVSDHQQGHDVLRNLSSSRVEMRLEEDNQTLMFIERNRLSDKCINYYINMSMELLHNPKQTMHPIEGKMEVDGVLGPYNDTAIVNFYETCPNCMMIVFNTTSMGKFLLNYRKEGHHQDVDHMKADHDTHRKMAECLGFDHDQPYIYNGVAAPVDNADRTKFLDDLEFPSITPAQEGELDQPLKPSEIADSIRLIQSGKAPGPDGYPIEFYKTCIDKLTPLLLRMFEDSLDRGTLPLTEAVVIVLLKPGKDNSECSSYRPISLLNVDYKILAKILAIRLESVTPNIISLDQTGFMKGRYSFSNIRRLLNILLSPASKETPEVVVSLDAQKAFDRVEWGFLFEVLKRFSLGSKFVSWIALLYPSPKAS
ncbi:hypothetical protein JOQ06_024653, partial [Pogonophryne albipinna]